MNATSDNENENSSGVLIILPAYNEEGKIGRVLEKIRQAEITHQVVVVDDCSTDATREEALAGGAEVITHERNSGVGAGIRTGLQYGLSHGYQIAVIMSGDDQHEPCELPLVLTPVLEDSYDFVQGSRRMSGGRVINGKLFRTITTIAYSWFFSVLTGRRITDATNGFRVFRLSILENDDIQLNQDWLDTYELEPYLLYKVVTSSSYRFKEAPITVRYHQTGKQYTKMRPFRDWWRLARPMFILRLGLRK